jgi:ABC-type antimicrobial peptide transport system permease subunit
MITFNWLTSVILIFSILGQNINEERIVFTILRALGMKKRTCILIVIFKLSVLGLTAVALSALAAPLILQLFSEFLAGSSSFSASIVLPAHIYLTSAAFIMATTLPSGLILGAYITGVKISEALRYE